MPPAKTPADTGTVESQYFEIARRQADALNELEARLAKHDEILRSLVSETKGLTFRVEAVEAQPVKVDYGDNPNQNQAVRPIRKRAEFCTECGGPLPNYHFDNCSQYRPPAA